MIETRSLVLLRLYAVNWVLALGLMIPFLRDVDAHDAGTAAFACAVFLESGLLYLLPFLLVALAVNAVVSWRALGGSPADGRGWRTWTPYAVAVVGFSTVQLFLFADARIYDGFGYHLNGFVWNILTTKGGIESLGAGESDVREFGLFVGFLVCVEAALLLFVARAAWFRDATDRAFRRGVVVAAVAGALALAVGERVVYAVCFDAGVDSVLVASGKFPFYRGLRVRGIAKVVGMDPVDSRGPRLGGVARHLRYPLAPIEQGPHTRWNVVWLACESLRADAVSDEVMPATSALARESTRFTHHYSAGNGTRMGMFGMFYGLYGPYWFPFLDESRGPVVLDVLRHDGYDMGAWTSAAFTFPEFDRTIFSQFPATELHTNETGIGWMSDRANVGDLLASIDRRDPARPFFRFMFFESPHAPYRFPPETAVRRPYLEDLDYMKEDTERVRRDIDLIRNRYLNACRHLDTQIARVVDHLRETGLLERTIVIVTGDHGEEFLEKGRWGHNSTYSEEQTRPPLLIRVPGRAPAVVDRMTSHLDIPATIMALLGVRNPASDYSLGNDLFGPERRRYTVVAQWSDIAYVDATCKIVLPMRAYGYVNRIVTDAADAPVPDPSRVEREHVADLADVMRSLGRFGR